MTKTIFGFDIGIASIGWAAVRFGKEIYNHETGEVTCGEILKSGVRTFPQAENAKDGKSLAAPRREKRLGRRLCRRKARRMQSVKNLFIAKKLILKSDLENLYKKAGNIDVWQLRVDALKRELNKEEFLRVLTHLAKHRGFKSYRKAEEASDAEGGKVLQAIKANKELLEENKTLAQVIFERNGLNGRKRNRQQEIEKNDKKEKVPCYVNSIPREEIEKETKIIFAKQKELGNTHATDDLYADFSRIAFRFRPIGSVEKMVGKCRFEKEEPRAPKNAPTAEFFVALSKINNLSIYENGEKRRLSSDEREKLFQLLKDTKEVKYSTIHKKIFKENEIIFADLNYGKTKKDKEGNIKQVNPEDEKFYSLKGWHTLKSALADSGWNELKENVELLDEIVKIITTQKNDEQITTQLSMLPLNQNQISALQSLTFKEFINLSLKALYKIVPFLEQGLMYSEACDKAGYDFRDTGESLVKQKGIYLAAIEPDKLTTVPVVNRALSQFRKVYNAMVRTYGEPDQINIEMARDIYNNFDERRRIKQKQDENKKLNEEAEAELREQSIIQNNTNILKLKLYKQQEGKCIYSNEPIDITRLDEQGYCEIDHIIPYSRSLDNSFNNKVLCLARENQNKTSHTPFEYLEPLGKWHEFKVRVASMMGLPSIKKRHLLNESFKDRETEFRERNLNDTRYMASYIKKYLEDGIDFSHSKENIINRVQTRNGALTDYLRHQWGLSKDREKDDLHHAQDAIVIACATQGMVKYLSDISGLWENKYNYTKKYGEAWYKALKTKFKEPWIGFRLNVEKSLEDIFVSRAPRHKATGEVHQETIRSLNPKHPNYNEKDLKSGINIRGGLANNGDMLRTDVFVRKNAKGKDEFYLVPIYLSDIPKGVLPNKAIVAFKDEAEWLEMDENYQFKFSLFLDDLVKVTKKEKEVLGYFKGTNRCLGQITIDLPDSSQTISSIGVKTLDKVQKYQVDPLGNYAEIKKETRLPLKRN